MKTCIAKPLEPNENLFIILDGWMKKYNTSPKHLSINNGISASIAVDWSQQSVTLAEKEEIISSLKKWAAKNQKIVIVTSATIIVLAASTIALKSPIVSLRNTETGRSVFLFDEVESISKKESSAELTTGVYYIDDKIEETSLTEAEINEKWKTSIYFLGSELMKSAAIKNSINQMFERYVQSKMIKMEESSTEPGDLDPKEVEPLAMEEPSSSLEDIVDTPTVLLENGGIEIPIPSYVRQTGLCPNYTSYSYFYGKWSKGTQQRNLSEQWGEAGMPSLNGIATLNDRFLVAVSPKFGRVGDYIDIVLSDGQIIPAIIADMKGADATSEWGHVLTESGAVDIIEWEASGAKSEIDLGSWRNVTVAKIINFGAEIEAQLVTVSEEAESTTAANLEEQQYIHLYSSIYGLNEEKVYQIISDMTSTFNGDLYLKYNIIEKRNASLCDSKEMAILLCIRNIYQNPEQYGVTATEIKGINTYHSDLNYAKQIKYFSNVLGVDAALNYAICQVSCNFKSPMFQSKNNPSNIMMNGSYATFPTVAAGFIEQTVELLEMQLEGNAPIEIIGTRMVTSNDDYVPSWGTNVTEVYSYVSKNYESIFGSNEEIQLLNQRIYNKSIS